MERRSSSPLRLSLLLLVALGAAGCGGERAAPTSLFDGSPVRPLPVVLEDVAPPVVLTKVGLGEAGSLASSSRGATCVARSGPGVVPLGRVVERVGVETESVTFRARAGLVACDNSAGPREGGRRWCGGSFGRLLHDRLRDPRVDLAGCRTEDGQPVAFAWVQPRPRTHYVVVVQPDYSEAYEVAAGMPVRVASAAAVEAEPLGATFEISEHDASGKLERRYRLSARPAG